MVEDRFPRQPTRDPLDWLPFLLQTTDPTFPTGGYAHSYGLEGAVELGLVHDVATLETFLQDEVLAALEGLELPFLRFAYEAQDVDEFLALDALYDASVLPAEARQASRQLGQRRLAILARIYDDKRLQSLQAQVQSQQTPGHQVIVNGLQAQVGGMPLSAALTAHAYQTLTTVLQASMKLIRIGQEGCQKLLTPLLQELPQVVETSCQIDRDDAGVTVPTLDLASCRHATAFSRLFIS
ncbi:MAG: urease accessory UreF family protein [Verrucomicrobiota bacterium JB022]|nr:urease accessory UreF family protein [Verrucomicrobiota bacterium JB022]